MLQVIEGLAVLDSLGSGLGLDEFGDAVDVHKIEL
jgi:hypothetical protein